jgi:hypothetical protein
MRLNLSPFPWWQRLFAWHVHRWQHFNPRTVTGAIGELDYGEAYEVTDKRCTHCGALRLTPGESQYGNPAVLIARAIGEPIAIENSSSIFTFARLRKDET